MKDDRPNDGTMPGKRVFCYRHVVSFQETNLVGNVYFTHHLSWQGRCREMFIRQYAPSVLEELADDLRLVTLKVACDYHCELFAFDEIDVEMRLRERSQNRIHIGFQYWRRSPQEGARSLIAEGMQLLATMRESRNGLVPCPLPRALDEALTQFAEPGGTAYA